MMLSLLPLWKCLLKVYQKNIQACLAATSITSISLNCQRLSHKCPTSLTCAIMLEFILKYKSCFYHCSFVILLASGQSQQDLRHCYITQQRHIAGAHHCSVVYMLHSFLPLYFHFRMDYMMGQKHF